MLDDRAMVDQLMAEMREHLPIPALPSKQLVRTLREQGVKIKLDRVLFIQGVHYLGDEGGISCDVIPAASAKEVLVISLTHLRIPADHALAAAVEAYQRLRVRRISTDARW